MYKNFFIRYWPIVLIIFVWFIFSYDYVVNNLVPFPSRYLVDFFSPWNNLYGHPVKNNAMPDVISQLYPWKQITIDVWETGEIPKWNPYQFAGNPHMANYQTAVFSPVNVLFFILPFLDAWSISILLQPLLAGLFMYWCIRSFGISMTGSVIGSIAFMFCGFMTVWMAYATLGYAVLVLPLIIYGTNKFFTTRNAVYLLLIATGILFSFVSGHVQSSLYVLFAAASYTLYRTIQDRRYARGIRVFLALAIGVVCALPQIMPTYQLLQQSVRHDYFQGIVGTPWPYLITIFAPDFFGNPVTRNDWFGYYAESQAFIGGTVVVLAGYALTVFRKQRAVRFFALFSLFCLLLIVQSPVLARIGSWHIPVISTINAARMIILVMFSFALLAGFGFDAVSGTGKNQVRNRIAVSSFFLVLTAGIWGLLFADSVLFVPQTVPGAVSIAQKNMLLPTGIIVIASAWIMFYPTLPAILKRMSTGLIIGLVVFDMMRFSQKWMPFDEREFVYPETPLLAFLEKNAGYERVYQNLKSEALMPYKLYGIEGYDPLYIERYGEFVRYAQEGSLIPAERSVVNAAASGMHINRLLDLLSVKYIIHSVQDEEAGWVVSYWNDPERFTLVYEDEYYHVYENTKRLPRVYLVHTYKVAVGEDILSNIYDDDFMLQNSVMIERDPPHQMDASCAADQDERADIVSYTPNRIHIKTQAECPGLLVLTDSYYDAWRATVNSEQTPILRTNYTLRSVYVPAGSSEIVFTL